jgi:uncharacterized protein
MELILLCVTAAAASCLSFFSGFGLATVITPVMILILPVEAAIAATAVIHLANNLFKFILVRGHIDRGIAFRFGVPAVAGAAIGATLLLWIPTAAPLATYKIATREFQMTGLKAVFGFTMILFALMEIIPAVGKLQFGRDKIMVGGLLSGFFGGLSGHQGALRSAFLMRFELNKEVFIATGIVIACAVDLVRIAIYSPRIYLIDWNAYGLPAVLACVSAFAGALLGNLLLKKVTIRAVQKIVGFALLIMGAAVSVGLI